MKKSILLVLASTALVFAAACSDGGPKTGDLCKTVDYPNGSQCHGSDILICENGILVVNNCKNGCSLVNNVATCSGEIQNDKCGSISSHGLCDGDVAKRCHNGEKLIVENCASKNQVCEKLKDTPVQCVSKGSGGECGGVTTEGTCNGQVLQRCVNDGLMTMICGVDQICVPASATSSAYCKDNGPDTGCGSVTAKGTCSSNVVQKCVKNRIVATECDSNQVCVVDSSGAYCKANDSDNKCGDVPATGICKGNSVEKCVDNAVVTSKCSASQICALGSDGAYCKAKEVTSKCGDVPAAGICKGNSVEKCINNAVVTTVCANDKKCVLGISGAFCIDEEDPSSGCGEVPASGICEGNVMKHCVNNRIQQRNCIHECVIWEADKKVDCAEPCPPGFSEIGLCKDYTLSYCDMATDGKAHLISIDCSRTASFYCGFNNEGGYFNCVNSSGCSGYPEHGICVGEELWKCKNGYWIETSSCGRDKCVNDKITILERNYVFGYCTSSCAGVSEKGICVDNMVKYCKENSLHIKNCPVAGLSCRLESGVAVCK